MNGKFDPTSGLANSGIAGTTVEKEDEENKNANADDEMRDASKKDGKLLVAFKTKNSKCCCFCILYFVRLVDDFGSFIGRSIFGWSFSSI